SGPGAQHCRRCDRGVGARMGCGCGHAAQRPQTIPERTRGTGAGRAVAAVRGVGVTYRTVDYGAMVRDRRRIEAFVAVLSKVVTPGSVVADLGAGTGVLAFIAL